MLFIFLKQSQVHVEYFRHDKYQFYMNIYFIMYKRLQKVNFKVNYPQISSMHCFVVTVFNFCKLK